MKRERETICPHCYNPVWLYEDETVTVCPFCNGIVFDDPHPKPLSAVGQVLVFLAVIFILAVNLMSCLV